MPPRKPRPARDVAKGIDRLKLTALGEFSVKYGAVTPMNFWRSLAKEVESCADEDGDYEFIFDERIAGLQEFRRLRREHGSPGGWPKSDGTQTDQYEDE